MKHKPPSDRMVETRKPRLSEADRRRIVRMRQQAGAVEVSVQIHIRPLGSNRAFQRLSSATRTVQIHSAFNVEQFLTGGPAAGLQFAATVDLLQHYEDIHQ